ncbi:MULTISPECIES: plasmid mobilization relaxosome protein MobC [unclassified Lactococcus]|uniref:plasmid mobilization protein n=1 Tax=unclassified Lactococcus TaxID=2643510 RepID=UPI0011CA6B5A|nr:MULTISPECIES: plasmid mobilization relaxosome protein MobC [unclassified Lactococcus]MQW24056.1 plasmid mobilization relaxosome protein MobC [Lactococcus sp. dk101]TXK36501.1 plasmid mobilization relaxosome protein MobC [Lactococcus sp. dk310]TXK47164.1 plasmid mobilization relaxosome protein MobC [Lactococcus sp. dk322]
MPKVYKLKRPIQKIIRLSEEENEYIRNKIEKSSFNNFQNFARTILIQGEVNTIDYSELMNLNRQVAKVGNNINQIVRLANQFNEISVEDIVNLQKTMSDLSDEVTQTIKTEMKKNRKII